MSSIRGKNTVPERKIRAYLKEKRFKFREHYRIGGFRVDFACVGKKLAIFVDGCFWHGCPRCYRPPKSRVSFWRQKVQANRARDKRIDKTVRALGWRILHIWEHQVRSGRFKI
ncbi:DUF559 domain-containing protein [Candidatus Kaiserbacteria bacterium]|nr:DUF559 domain-containing protein [Candidatus Kaiserbacteria bacterium]